MMWSCVRGCVFFIFFSFYRFFLFEIFSPIVLAPADLWYDSRFPAPKSLFAVLTNFKIRTKKVLSAGNDIVQTHCLLFWQTLKKENQKEEKKFHLLPTILPGPKLNVCCFDKPSSSGKNRWNSLKQNSLKYFRHFSLIVWTGDWVECNFPVRALLVRGRECRKIKRFHRIYLKGKLNIRI